ncbi:protein S100-A7-like [Trichechus manatus latirostris]|uniref:Protein S100-A7-like n=1 Tax=Trichechus manatus latirostris TaxID=127582 RepID=A0A2Y9G3E9_TRIMA|nr:protein S100-A7-like [Trichechus manatus latirostris]
MSNSQAEKTLMDLIKLFYKYTGQDDLIAKLGLLIMMMENFPNFLMPDKRGTDYLANLFETKDENGYKKIDFYKFLSTLGGVVTNYHRDTA